MFMMTLQVVTAAMIGQFSPGQPLPTPTDHLKAPQGEKHVSLILDISNSMNWGPLPEPCLWYQSQPFFTGTAPNLTKIDQGDAPPRRLEATREGARPVLRAS